MQTVFRRLANWAADTMGSSRAFVVALVLVVGWAVTGPLFAYSDAWQLAINSITSIVTFLMVFLIQHAQARDTRAMQLKLDELLRAVSQARTHLVNLEALSDEELDLLQEEFQRLRERENPARRAAS